MLPARAQTDEIQVYTAEINEPGQFSIQSHNNYTPKGRKEPDFPGGIVPNHAVNGALEWAYGATEWMELGLYLPLYSVTGERHFLWNGAKIRALLVTPEADERTFFYGINFELSHNARHWERTRSSGEIRPIAGFRVGRIDFIINPIVDTSFQGGIGRLNFTPAERIAYKFSEARAVAVEHYADYGEFKHSASASNQSHTLFAVADYGGESDNVEFGIGRGLTRASDDWIFKLMLMHAF